MLEDVVAFSNKDRNREFFAGEYNSHAYGTNHLSFFLEKIKGVKRAFIRFRAGINELFGYSPFCLPDIELPTLYREPSKLGSGYELVRCGGREYLFGHDKEGKSYLVGRIRGRSFTAGNKRAVFLKSVLDFSFDELEKLPNEFRDYLPKF